MGKDFGRRTNDEGSEQPTIRVVRFPTNGERRIECPVCRGNKCAACRGTGMFEIRGDIWADIQQPLVAQYVHDNLTIVSHLFSQMYGSGIEVKSLGMLKKHWEIWLITSLVGSLWFCVKTDGQVRVFNSEGGMKKWLASGK